MTKLETGRFSRRSLLKGVGAGALGAGIGLTPFFSAQAQGDMSELPLAVERMSVGDITVTAFKEAQLQLQPAMFGGGAPEGAVTDLLAQYNLPTDGVAATANVMLLEGGGELTLVDTGTGSNLVGSLEALGVASSDIGAVILSHWHGDHVGGVATDGALNFPNATHYFPQADWDFLQSAPSDNSGAQDALGNIQAAEAAGLLELYGDAQEFAPGVTAVAAPGHTPGHSALMIASGDAQLMYTADTAAHFLVSLLHPEWSFAFDGDPAQASDTRVQLLGRAADEGLKIFAYHFPFPGAGYVAREGEGFRFLPYH